MSEVVLRGGDDGPVLSNGAITVSAHLNRGTFSISGAEVGASVHDAATSVALHEGPSFTSRGIGFFLEGQQAVSDTHGEGLALTLRREADEHEPEFLLTITVYEKRPFAVLQSEVANHGRSPVRVQAFRVMDGARLDLGSLAEDWRFYKEGWQNWSPALVLPVSGEDIPMSPPVVAPRTRPPEQPGRFLSELMTAIAAPGRHASLVAGFTTTADQFSQLWLDRDGATLTAASYADGIEVPPGARLTSERLLVEPATEPHAAMRRHADALARDLGAVPWPSPIAGWCSWYYYFQRVSEEDILANLDAIAERRRELPFEYVQIDDGYQAGIGDWLTPNEKFPHGMGWLADRIHDRGLKAGLWLAPFLMGEKSRLWAQHPEWAVQYKRGKPHIASLNWEQRCHALDLTRPEAISWLEDTFRTVFDDWGYDYVKIDFIYAGAVDGIRFDPNLTRAQAYRRGIDKIREVAGERFILGCGQPIGPSIGVVNGARIGPDVAPHWHPKPRDDERNEMSAVSTLNALRNILSRSWMHGRLWLSDPDCLMVRLADTSLTTHEAQTLTTVIALSGRMVLDSDDLTKLTDERREVVSMLLPVNGKTAVPLDLFTANGMPRLYELDCGTHRVLGVFNWEDDAATVDAPLPATKTHAFEAWSRRYLGQLTGGAQMELPAHGCALLRLTDGQDRPQVIGSTFHLLQGAVEVDAEDWEGETLSVRLRPVAKAQGELFLSVPASFGEPTAEGAEVTTVSEGVWSVALRVDEERDLRITFG